MKTILTWAIFVAFCLFASQVQAAGQAAGKADEPESLQFVHLLQQNGYGDMAVEYLNMLAKQADLPAEIRKVWDLEMSESLRAAADLAYDDKESEQLKAEAQKHLDKFLKENPDHPAADAAVASWAEFQLKRVLWRLQTAQALESNDKDAYAKEMNDIRGQLAEIRKKFVEASERFQKQVDKLPPPPTLSAKPKQQELDLFSARNKVEFGLHESLWQVAMIEYHLAQTYPPKSEERIAALKNAVKELDGVYQNNRYAKGGQFVVALYALLWEGKAAEESGDSTLALDIYEEVLAGAPSPAEIKKSSGGHDPMESLYTQTAFFRFQILAKKNPKAFFEEARAWLKEHDGSQRTDGYQGVALEMAKALIAAAENANATEKTRRLFEAKRILKDMAGVSGPHHQEAVQLRRQLSNAAAGQASSGAVVEAVNYEDAVAQGDAFLDDNQLEQARDAYRKAIELAGKKGRPDEMKIHAAVEGLCKSQLRLAVGLYKKKNYDECLALLAEVVYDDAAKKVVRKDIPSTSLAASLAVNVAMAIYADAAEDKRPAALAKLTEQAKVVEDNWPARPEADDARMAVAHVQYSLGKVRDAVEVFDKVSPKSERYPLAMYRAGQIHASLYWEQKKKPAGECDQQQMAADRAKAVAQLKAGLEVLEKQREPGKPLPEYFAESQLLLADIYLDAGEMKEAAPLFQDLVDVFKENGKQSFDESMIGVFRGALQTYAALDEVEKAGEVGSVLLDIGPDHPKTDAVLVGFAERLDLERRKAVGLITELEHGNRSDELVTARKKLADLEQMLGKFLGKLAARQEISLAGMVFLGDALSAVNRTADAGEEYKKILDRAARDPEFARTAEKGLTRVHSQLAGLLRKQGNYEEALTQIDQLLKTHPRALEPLMEKGYILEGLAEKDPARFREAIGHWARLRNMLPNISPAPAEYYDVTYHAASCLMREAEKSNDKAVVMERANTAEKVLKSVLILNPKLNGPDNVARYKVLLDRVITLQGRSPDEK
jgi:hypothetical protein